MALIGFVIVDATDFQKCRDNVNELSRVAIPVALTLYAIGPMHDEGRC